MKNKMIDIQVLKGNAERAMEIISSMMVITEAHLEVLEKTEMDNATFKGGIETLTEHISILKNATIIGMTLIDENGSDFNKELKIHKELGANGRYLALFFRTITEEISEFESRLEKIKSSDKGE